MTNPKCTNLDQNGVQGPSVFLFFSIFVAIFGKVGTLLLKVMLAGEDFSKRLLNDPSEIAERSRDHSRDTLAISAAILEQRII